MSDSLAWVTFLGSLESSRGTDQNEDFHRYYEAASEVFPNHGVLLMLESFVNSLAPRLVQVLAKRTRVTVVGTNTPRGRIQWSRTIQKREQGHPEFIVSRNERSLDSLENQFFKFVLAEALKGLAMLMQLQADPEGFHLDGPRRVFRPRQRALWLKCNLEVVMRHPGIQGIPTPRRLTSEHFKACYAQATPEYRRLLKLTRCYGPQVPKRTLVLLPVGKVAGWHEPAARVYRKLRFVNMDMLSLGVDLEGNPLSTPRTPSGTVLEGDAEAAERRRKTSLGRDYGVANFAGDPNDLARMGWAVVFPLGNNSAIKEALRPLLDLRKHQAGPLYQEFEVDLQVTKTARQWVRSLKPGLDFDAVDPTRGLPYFVLIVGDPNQIPFEFQFSLDLCWAVGRIWFPTVDEYHCYAKKVVASEGKILHTKPDLAVFSTQHLNDEATRLFRAYFSRPLVGESLKRFDGSDAFATVYDIAPEQATLAKLREVLDAGCSVLLSGTHGLEMPSGHQDQTRRQGGLVCQNWSGRGRIQSDQVFCGEHVDDNPEGSPLIHLSFACYSAGTPRLDHYAKGRQLAPDPFISSLPSRLLSRGRALACLGHVDRAWSFSFSSAGATRLEGFKDLLSRIASGTRVGHASDMFNQRWATLTTNLEEIRGLREQKDVTEEDVQRAEVERTDARNYIILGDPAVRLNLSDGV